MKSHTRYKTFHTAGRRELIRITEDVQTAVDEAGIAEGMAIVAAMHITAAVWINDDEPGLHEDTLEWLDKIAPPSWKEPANDVARARGVALEFADRASGEPRRYSRTRPSSRPIGPAPTHTTSPAAHSSSSNRGAYSFTRAVSTSPAARVSLP